MILDKKIIVVTGGAGLLGAHFCTSIASEGAQVIIADVDLEAAEQVAKAIRVSGGEASAIFLDIADEALVEETINIIHEQHKQIDALVNNAYPRNKKWGQKLENVAYADFCENMSLHLGGYFLMMQKYALYFRKQGGGNIINMASIYGTLAPRFEVYADTSMTMPVEYAAIKSSIIQLTRYFAQYFKEYGIRCNSLSPGGIFDNQQQSFVQRYNRHCGKKGMLDVKDIVGTLIYLLSDASQFVTGQNLVVDDGFCL